MNSKDIIKVLENNGLSDIEEISYKEGFAVIRFFYDFDEDELKAARAYAKDECEEEEESESWYEDYFLPYLNDLAIDNVGEIMEEIMEEFGAEAQYISYELDSENYEYNEFVAVVVSGDKDLNIEEVLDELDI
ncbi:hypothetical protein [Desnuesiella massiliensis]|uniref:hypothetical protein n=1 Tax=Desnuesiella massiliensis TaxID=1650662 RepID=UPI0006E33595|nr:hypothetical protein [Desnuesiella massiliensis]